jgi:hypothetical protein
VLTEVPRLLTLALSAAVVVGGCGGHPSASTSQESVVPSTTERVYIATTLACRDLGSESARFIPLMVRGPGYATTIEPTDGCRRQQNGPTPVGATTTGHWYSYVYDVPTRASGELHLTPGNQPSATVNAAKFELSHAATIYYVNCADYYANCPPGRRFQGRITRIEYFKDDDVQAAP